ncbi:exported hypothetical protein [Candidatus Desulfarcum epimagneticum]|uniref:Uncharacterized protein n=1 Tax=uncultured Desulfobacteraceae bacterium TaxID=218296 RepID=A0A484HJZ2_9BACT|nr:exported hypothetical protein [uncultured Desulfobacteraceae bacterium]
MIFKRIVFWALLTVFVFSSVSGHAARRGVKTAENPGASEPAALLNIPARILEKEIKSLALGKGSVVKEIFRLDLDPVRRLAVVAGIIEIPAGILRGGKGDSGAGASRHDFMAAISFPSAKMTARTRYLRLQIVELKLDGHSHLQAARVATNFLSVLLTETGLARYLLYEGKGRDASGKDLKDRISAFIENRGLIFREGAVSVKLDLKAFGDLRKFSPLADFRMWRFAPALFRGQPAFRIEAGVGKPGKAWLEEARKKTDRDAAFLKKAREKQYPKYADIGAFQKDLDAFIERRRSVIGFPESPPGPRRRDMETFSARMEARARSELSVRNPLFKAWPKKTHDRVLKEARNEAERFYDDLNQRIKLEAAIARGGRDAPGLPFAEKLVSQRAIDQAIRYYRHVKVDGQSLFSSLDAVLAPHLPGFIVRGALSLDIGRILSMAAKGRDVAEKPIRARAFGGSSVPFEAALRLWMKDGNVASLDVAYVSLFSGSDRMVFSNKRRHGHFLFDFARMLLMKSAASMLADKPPGGERMDISFDAEHGKIDFAINPRVLVKEIMGVRNDIQAWDFEPVYFREMDQTFLKMAAGDGVRTKDYVQSLVSGKFKADSDAFSGTGGAEGPLDLRIILNIRSVQKIANRILEKIHEKESRKVREAVFRKTPGTHYLVEKISLEPVENRLRMSATASRVKISKRWVINPARWVKGPYFISEKRASVYADLGLSAVVARDVMEESAPGRFDLSRELLKLEITGAGFDIENPSLAQNVMVGLVGDLDLDGSAPSGIMKRFILKKIAPYLNAAGENEGKTEIAGVRLNRFVKIFTHTGDIYFQINPRLVSPAFDVALISNRTHNGVPLGFFMEPSRDRKDARLVFDFKTRGAMPEEDKAALLAVARMADSLFKPYLDEKSPERLLKELKKLKLFDRAFHSGDLAKLSLFHRIRRMMGLYYPIARLTLASGAEPPHGRDGDLRIGATGIEIVCFLEAAAALEKNTAALIERAKKAGIAHEVPYMKEFGEFKTLLAGRIIAPLAEKYERDHRPVNRRMLKRGVTDWNRHYYPEAEFSALVYGGMEKARNRK